MNNGSASGPRVAWFDCATGASGDMILGALVDAGADVKRLRAALRSLPVTGWRLSARSVQKHGLAATKVDVVLTGSRRKGAPTAAGAAHVVDPGHAISEAHAQGHAHPHTHGAKPAPAGARKSAAAGAVPHVALADILHTLRHSRLPEGISRRAVRVFEALGREEAGIHGIPLARVHFHEVGAVDALVDIVGALLALDLLGVSAVHVSALPMSRGTVRCAHGILPVPAPATLGLLRGAPWVPTPLEGELVTPTAAAIFACEAASFGSFPAMVLERVGYGAGTRDLPDRANVLRVLLGSASSPTAVTRPPSERVWVVEASLDDAPGEAVGYAFERLFAAGALDVHAVPVHMKKNRPGVVLSAIVPESALLRVEGVFLRETTTFGVRRHAVERSVLPRERKTVRTRFGPVRVKVGLLGGEVVTVHPEYEDCRALAEKKGVPLRTVIAAAHEAWSRLHKV